MTVKILIKFSSKNLYSVQAMQLTNDKIKLTVSAPDGPSVASPCPPKTDLKPLR